MDCGGDTAYVFIAMIVLSDENGIIKHTPESLARAICKDVASVREAIRNLESQDPASNLKAHHGRRIVALSEVNEDETRGWLVVNKSHYRDKKDLDVIRAQTRDRVRRFRLRSAGLPEQTECAYCGDTATGPDHVIPKASGGIETVPACGRCNQRKANRTVADFLNDQFCDFIDHERVRADLVLSRHFEISSNGSYQPVTQRNNKKRHTDTDTDTRTTLDAKASLAGFEILWKTYPKRAGNNPKRKAESAYKARLLEKHTPAVMLDGASRYARFVRATGKEGTEYVLQTATFLGKDKPFLQPWAAPNGQGSWDRTETATLAKGSELGLPARPGESMEEYRGRIRARLAS